MTTSTRASSNRAFLAVTGSRVAATGTQALTLVVVARLAGPADFAFFAVIFGFLQVAQVISDLGATNYVLSNSRDWANIQLVLRLGRYATSCVALVASSGLLLTSLFLRSPLAAELAPLGTWLGLERAAEVRSALLIAHRRAATVAYGLVGRRLVVLIGVSLAFTSIDSWALLFSVSSVVGSGLALMYYASESKRLHAHEPTDFSFRVPSLQFFRDNLAFFWSASIAQQIRQLDTLVLGLIAAPAAVVAYAPASRLMTPLRLLPTTYAQVLLTDLSLERRRPTLRETVRATIVSILLYGPLAATTFWWLPILLGTAYEPSAGAVAISIASLMPLTVMVVVTAGEQAVGRSRFASHCAWLGGLSTLMCIGVLGHFFSGTVAASSNIIGTVLNLGTLLAIRAEPTRTRGKHSKRDAYR